MTKRIAYRFIRERQPDDLLNDSANSEKRLAEASLNNEIYFGIKSVQYDSQTDFIYLDTRVDTWDTCEVVHVLACDLKVP